MIIGSALVDARGFGAYGFRYPFVIYGFSLAETENLGRPFLLGRALEIERFGTFLTSRQNVGLKPDDLDARVGVTDRRLIRF
jgi:hypothetical protein